MESYDRLYPQGTRHIQDEIASGLQIIIENAVLNHSLTDLGVQNYLRHSLNIKDTLTIK